AVEPLAGYEAGGAPNRELLAELAALRVVVDAVRPLIEGGGLYGIGEATSRAVRTAAGQVPDWVLEPEERRRTGTAAEIARTIAQYQQTVQVAREREEQQNNRRQQVLDADEADLPGIEREVLDGYTVQQLIDWAIELTTAAIVVNALRGARNDIE